jgi:hypothetical protein
LLPTIRQLMQDSPSLTECRMPAMDRAQQDVGINQVIHLPGVFAPVNAFTADHLIGKHRNASGQTVGDLVEHSIQICRAYGWLSRGANMIHYVPSKQRFHILALAPSFSTQ